jgi:hypothetical protein
LKALTVRTPHAQDIIRHGKWIENRSWQTHHRGPLLIHVSQAPASPESGFIIGIVDLAGCVKDSPRTSGDKWAIPGMWHWILENPRELKIKIPAKGQLSIWDYDIDPASIEEVLSAMTKFPKSTKIDFRIEDALLPQIPEQGHGRNKYINDAIREKLDGTDLCEAASAMGKIGGSAATEKKIIASRENGKKGGRPVKKDSGKET